MSESLYECGFDDALRASDAAWFWSQVAQAALAAMHEEAQQRLRWNLGKLNECGQLLQDCAEALDDEEGGYYWRGRVRLVRLGLGLGVQA